MISLNVDPSTPKSAPISLLSGGPLRIGGVSATSVGIPLGLTGLILLYHEQTGRENLAVAIDSTGVHAQDRASVVLNSRDSFTVLARMN